MDSKGTSLVKKMVERNKEVWERYVQLAEEAREEVGKAEGREEKVGDGIVVTPLGTGSAIPSKYRNGELFPLLLYHSWFTQSVLFATQSVVR